MMLLCEKSFFLYIFVHLWVIFASEYLYRTEKYCLCLYTNLFRRGLWKLRDYCCKKRMDWCCSIFRTGDRAKSKRQPPGRTALRRNRKGRDRVCGRDIFRNTCKTGNREPYRHLPKPLPGHSKGSAAKHFRPRPPRSARCPNGHIEWNGFFPFCAAPRPLQPPFFPQCRGANQGKD